jgi:hypothetical protein
MDLHAYFFRKHRYRAYTHHSQNIFHECLQLQLLHVLHAHVQISSVIRGSSSCLIIFETLRRENQERDHGGSGAGSWGIRSEIMGDPERDHGGSGAGSWGIWSEIMGDPERDHGRFYTRYQLNKHKKHTRCTRCCVEMCKHNTVSSRQV